MLSEVNRSEIIHCYLNTTSKGLQCVSEIDFGTTDHRRCIVRYLRAHTSNAMMGNLDNVIAMNMSNRFKKVF